MCRTIQTYVDTHASMPATAMYQYTARLYMKLGASLCFCSATMHPMDF